MIEIQKETGRVNIDKFVEPHHNISMHVRDGTFIIKNDSLLCTKDFVILHDINVEVSFGMGSVHVKYVPDKTNPRSCLHTHGSSFTRWLASNTPPNISIISHIVGWEVM